MSSPEGQMLDEVRVSLATLSEESQQQVLDAVEFAQATHTTDELDVRQVVQDAEAADYHRAQADEYQQLQAKAVSDGNWEEAREYAARAQGELETVADHGGSDVPVAEAEQDVTNLDNSRWEQRQANDNARAAASYAEDGDYSAAQIYSGEAARHQVLADEAGHEGLSGARDAQSGDGGLEGDSVAAQEHAPDAAATDAAAPVESTMDAAPDA
jgi:hypothetical protein